MGIQQVFFLCWQELRLLDQYTYVATCIAFKSGGMNSHEQLTINFQVIKSIFYSTACFTHVHVIEILM